jgi:hypothetical protein
LSQSPFFVKRYKATTPACFRAISVKSPLGVFLLAILMCASIFAAFISIDVVQGAQTVTGILTADTTWTKTAGPYAFTGNVLVSNGVKLTIDAGAIVNLNGYLLMINGTLNARGISIDRIAFNGGGTITFTSYGTSWNEQTQTGSIIEYANLGAAKVTMTGVNPKFNYLNAQSIDIGGLGILTNSVFTTVSISGSPIVTGNTISGTLQINSDSSTPTLSYNIITGGLYSYGGTATIVHNSIGGSLNVTSAAHNTVIDSNTINGGMTINSAAATISNNTIKGGIRTNSDAINIYFNTLSNSNVGIEFTPIDSADYLNGTISGNTITATQTGISVPPAFSAFIYGWSTSALIINNTIYNCQNAAIDVGGGSGQYGTYPLNNITVISNLFYANNYAVKTAHPNLIANNTFINNYYAISGGGEIRGNIVANNTYGISAINVTANFVVNNKYGIVAGINIQNNTVFNNQVGIYTGFQLLNYNNIYGNTLNLNYSATVDGNANVNWWGTTDPSAISASIIDYNDNFLLGRVNTIPILTGLNTQAPSPDTPIIPETQTALLTTLMLLVLVATIITFTQTKPSNHPKLS